MVGTSGSNIVVGQRESKTGRIRDRYEYMSVVARRAACTRGGTGQIFLALNLIASEYIFFVLPSP